MSTKDTEDLKDAYLSAATAPELLATVWADSCRNAAAVNYMAGMIDALRYSGRLTIAEYSDAYARYVHG